MLMLLALISAFVPLSTDLYLPALPGMVKSFATTEAHLNSTLTLFFIFYAAGILFWGPMTDKFGRKPILTTGLIIYTLSSAGCAMSGSISTLIVFRICQAVGGGASTAVSTAVVKDYYSGEKREKALALIMTMVTVAPVVAPLIGGFLLRFFSWHAAFWVLTGFGTAALAFSTLLGETLAPEHRSRGSVPSALLRLIVVMKNPGFCILFFLFSTLTMPMMGFIGSASYVYIQKFGLSEQTFSYFFTFNALCATSAPLFSIHASRRFGNFPVIMACYLYICITGILVLFVGGLSPVLFALLIAPVTFFLMLVRPLGVNLMLDQQERDTGSASALINSGGMIMGSLGMALVSTELSKMMPTLAYIQIFVGLAGGLVWLASRNRDFLHPGNKR